MGKKTEHYPYDDIKTHCFHIVFDLDKNGNICQSEEDWCDEVFDEIPNFALGDEKAREISKDSPRKATRHGMKLLYEVKEIKEANAEYLSSNPSSEDKYLKRGEFGELILYYLLKKKLGKPQLISKIYFKDSSNAVVHGFDAVHYDKESNELWIGESKFYKNKNSAIGELADDLDKHFNLDFFEQEFTIISDRFKDSGIQNDEIKNLIDPNTKFISKLVNMNACFFALFDDKILQSFSYEQETDKTSQDFLDKLKISVEKTRQNFDYKTINFQYKKDLKIHLFLFPVESKYKLVRRMHEKLKKEQS